MAANYPETDDWEEDEENEKFYFYHKKCPDGIVLAENCIIFPEDKKTSSRQICKGRFIRKELLLEGNC